MRRRYFLAKKLRFPECDPKRMGNGASRREFRPYEGLASVWDHYASSYRCDYPAFIEKLAKAKRLELHAILDLACGTGTITSRLTGIARQIVGLDASEAMLDQARSRYGHLPGVRFVQGDFREFQLGQSFDLVLCTSNSLNYVNDVGELRAVFRMVAQHLRPDGLFVFDTLTEAGMRLMSGKYLHIQLDEIRFAMLFQYDRENRKDRAKVLLPSGNEIHAQIPIDRAAVDIAAQDNGLIVENDLSRLYWIDWLHLGHVGFFILRRDRG